jgi:hypothetical protein
MHIPASITRRHLLGIGALASALLAACGDGSDDVAKLSINNDLAPRPSATPTAGLSIEGGDQGGANRVTTPSGLQ